MISLIPALLIGASALAAAFVTGIFGMVGGQILLAVLLYYMPVSIAITLFSALMFASGFWRSILWYRYIVWSTTVIYLAGSVLGYIFISFISFVPSKPIVYLGLGLTPFIGNILPPKYAPDISKGPMAFICGFIVMVLQIAIGAGGNVLDMFFQASPYNRYTIVATKAITQLFSQVMRFFYFGALALDTGETMPWWLFVIYVCLIFAGGSAAGSVLNRMTDKNFRRWTKWLIYFFSSIYVARGIWLLVY
jgi:uncharacterized membrane protein YfcA